MVLVIVLVVVSPFMLHRPDGVIDRAASTARSAGACGERYLVGERLSVEVDGVHVHLVAHSQKVPVHLLALRHLQAAEVPVQLSVNP